MVIPQSVNMATFEVARHLEGCPCGYGDRTITPIDYLTKCLLVRFQNHRGFGEFDQAIPITRKTLGEGLADTWEKEGIYEHIGRRPPLLCPQGYPSKLNPHEDYGVVTRAAFFNLSMKYPYNGASNGTYQRARDDITAGMDLKSYIFFSHWIAELDPCPCPNTPSYLTFWGDDDEEYGIENALKLEFVEGRGTLKKGKTSTKIGYPYIRQYHQFEHMLTHDSISLWMESPRVNSNDPIYELHHLFEGNTQTKELSIPNNKRFLLVIPRPEMWERAKHMLAPDEEAKEIRPWGPDDYFLHSEDGAAYLVIYGRYNSTSCRIFNQLNMMSGGREDFATEGGYNLEVFYQDGQQVKRDGNNLFFGSGIQTFKIHITKRRGQVLQKLYFFRIRIFSEETIANALGSMVKPNEINWPKPHQVEFLVSAKEKYFLELRLDRVTSSKFTLDIQELESIASKREISHTTLRFRRGED
jgi:hypothetical protein